jgi:hypothetical protein
MLRRCDAFEEGRAPGVGRRFATHDAAVVVFVDVRHGRVTVTVFADPP